MVDETIPEYFRGRSVCPNIASPKIVEPSKDEEKIQPKHVMYAIEAVWMFKHAWRGAGLYYRSGDHQVPKSETANKPTSMYKALSMYPVWDKWLMPRCEPIAERFYASPKKWSMSEYDDEDSFGDLPPLGYVRFEYQIVEELKFSEGNLFRLWYELLGRKTRCFGTPICQRLSKRLSIDGMTSWLTSKPERSSEQEPYEEVVNLDPRFHYYDKYVDIVSFLPEVSTRDQEEAKSSIWELEGHDLELCMAMDPESFAAKAMNPKKRKPDPETEGEGITRHPTAKRKPDVNIQKPLRILCQQVHQLHRNHLHVDPETPSESHSRSASGVIEPPHARPTHTPISTGEGTDAERQEEVLIAATVIEREFDELPLDVMTPEEELIIGVPERDIQSLLYLAYPEIVEAREYIDPIIHKVHVIVETQRYNRK